MLQMACKQKENHKRHTESENSLFLNKHWDAWEGNDER